jgi:hypothetical protein
MSVSRASEEKPVQTGSPTVGFTTMVVSFTPTLEMGLTVHGWGTWAGGLLLRVRDGVPATESNSRFLTCGFYRKLLQGHANAVPIVEALLGIIFHQAVCLPRLGLWGVGRLFSRFQHEQWNREQPGIVCELMRRVASGRATKDTRHFVGRGVEIPTLAQ